MKDALPIPTTVEEMAALLAEGMKADVLRGIVTAARRRGLTDAEIDAIGRKSLEMANLAITAQSEFPFSIAEAVKQAKLVVRAYVDMAKNADRV